MRRAGEQDVARINDTDDIIDTRTLTDAVTIVGVLLPVVLVATEFMTSRLGSGEPGETGESPVFDAATS